MTTQQIAVAQDLTNAFAGTLVDQYNNEVSSYVSEEASDEMPFGVMLIQGTNNRQALLFNAQADVPIGILTHSHAFDKPNELGDVGLKPNVTLGVLTHGRIWVTVEDAVVPGDPVRYRAVATGGEVPGAFLTAADGTDTVDISSFARWITSAGIAGLAQLEIDMTGAADRSSDV